MTTKTIKTILFASLIAAMILPFAMMEVATADEGFKIKSDFKSEKEAKKYYKQLEKEIKFAYKDAKESPTVEEKRERYNDLKANVLELMAKYSPDEKPTNFTEDEWFDYIENRPTNSKATNVVYEEGSSSIYGVGSGSVAAKTGYRAPCDWAPIIPCDNDFSQVKTVSTSHTSGVDFIGYTSATKSWITPYFKMSPAALFKTYVGVGVIVVDPPGSAGPYNSSVPFSEYAYPLTEFKLYGNTVGSSCGCTSVSANTSIQTNIDLNNVT